MVAVRRDDAQQADQYLDDRASRGFNTLLVNLIENRFASNPPRNAYGDAPFLSKRFRATE